MSEAMLVIRRQAMRATVSGKWRYLDGDRYYSHSVGSTIYWTAMPWRAAVYITQEDARASCGWSWMCEIVGLDCASEEAQSRRE
jgi:hypothetical protein